MFDSLACCMNYKRNLVNPFFFFLKVDYLRKISLKMLTMDASSQNPMTSFVPSTSGGNDKNPADSGN